MEVDMAVEKISAHSISFQTDLSTKPVPAKRSSEWPVLESETGRLYKTSDTASLISIRTGEESESEDDSELYVGMPLPSANFSLEELQTHLSTHNWTEAGQKLLSEIGENGESVITPGIFDKYSRVEEEQHHQHHTVFDVRTDGTPISRSKIEHSEDRVDGDGELWSVIQNLNSDSSLPPVAGRISLVREPTPVVLAALHLTLNGDFDMDELFGFLVEEDNSTAHIHRRAFSDDERRQRSYVFKFDYFTVVGEGLQPMPWQRTDDPEKVNKRSDKHIPISRCSSIVALSLSGNPIATLKNVARRARTEEGFIYDTWAPWTVLNIQCYPDHEHTMDSHDSTNHYVNGPEAFLHTLLAEFKDAQKRFKIILVQVTELVVPPANFIFDSEVRDKLLFEDDNYTYSRRYFWVYQTLALMSNGIKAILKEYKHTFTDDVWEGKHKSLWPLIDNEKLPPHRNEYWRHRLAQLKNEFEAELKNLKDILEENECCREEIKSLESQLFQGTSVLESRKSVQLSAVTILQGHNIKLLTLVTIFFLPVTFVTSVFGMTNMPSENNFRDFGITMATVCIPFCALVGSLNTTKGSEFWRKNWKRFSQWLSRKRPKQVKMVEPLERDNIGPGNPRMQRRTQTIRRAVTINEIKKTRPREDNYFPSQNVNIRNTFSLMPHQNAEDRLSTEFISERSPSRASERRYSNTMEMKPRMSSITPVSSSVPEGVIDLKLENSPSILDRFRRKKSYASHTDKV